MDSLAFCTGILLAMVDPSRPVNRSLLFDFTNAKAADGWRAIDDRVMGGLSQSRLAPTAEESATFEGTISLANNGGFASIRSPEQERDLSGAAGVWLLVRGDDHEYSMNLRGADDLQGIDHRHSFRTRKGEWEEIFLPFDDFVPMYRGVRVLNSPRLKRDRVITVGFMFRSKEPGPFRLEIKRIEVEQSEPSATSSDERNQ